MSTKSVSKRQEIRAKRVRQQRVQRLLVVGVILAVGLLLIALAAGPALISSYKNATTPLGTYKTLTPQLHPNAQTTHLGDPNAPAKIDIYEDFQCIACEQYTTNTEPQVIKDLVATGKAYYSYHTFIVIDQATGGTESAQAANAAMCANDQGKFWEYHDMLYQNWNGEGQGAFIDKRLVAFAQSIGLDMNKFNTCFKNNTFKSQIQADISAGEKAGVTGTPSVFVNGKEIAPGQIPTYAQIQAAVQAASTK